MAAFIVIGTSKILGVSTGGRVDLDPDKYNIPALIAGGHIEPVKNRVRRKADETEEEEAE